MRQRINVIKSNMDRNNNDILDLNEKIVNLKNKLLEIGEQSVEKLDREILEMKFKLKQIKLTESNGNKHLKSDKLINSKVFNQSNDNSIMQLKID